MQNNFWSGWFVKRNNRASIERGEFDSSPSSTRSGVFRCFRLHVEINSQGSQYLHFIYPSARAPSSSACVPSRLPLVYFFALLGDEAIGGTGRRGKDISKLIVGIWTLHTPTP